jgi:hypothetical protein
VDVLKSGPYPLADEEPDRGERDGLQRRLVGCPTDDTDRRDAREEPHGREDRSGDGEDGRRRQSDLGSRERNGGRGSLARQRALDLADGVGVEGSPLDAFHGNLGEPVKSK